MKFLEKLCQSAPLAKIQCRPVRCVRICQWVSRPYFNHIFEDVVNFGKARLGWLCYGAVQEPDTRVPVAVNTESYAEEVWVAGSHIVTPDHPMGVESDSQIFQLRDALSRTEAGFSMDRDAIVKFCGYRYKRNANCVLCSTVRSVPVRISTWIDVSDGDHTRKSKYRVPEGWQVLGCLFLESTSA